MTSQHDTANGSGEDGIADSMWSIDHARSLDGHDPIRHIRHEFRIPTKGELRSRNLSEVLDSPTTQGQSQEQSIYLCGNSLGLQPRLTVTRVQQHLKTWSTQGVFGHFKPSNDSPLPTWLDADKEASAVIAPIVGAEPSEVAVMETLTANLHLLMAAFYKPDIKARHKIILESKAFPSDHFVAESQIRHHGLSPSTSMVTIEPLTASDPTLTTCQILETISAHASTTSILLLPGIQYYTGQLFSIAAITAAAQAAGLFVIWDLAHAVGNVPLKLHDWNVDAAVWCSYKYLNAGPGAIGGLYIHSRHSNVSSPSPESQGWADRFSGWWGNDKASRYKMSTIPGFIPSPGAAGFQLSNPSILDITSLTASLEVFSLAGGVSVLRQKSMKLTGFLESLLVDLPAFGKEFWIITPREEENRGAQLSIKLSSGYLDIVMKELENRSVVVDERRPDVIRVAPAPLYNSFVDVLMFVEAFREALAVAAKATRGEVFAEGTADMVLTS